MSETAAGGEVAEAVADLELNSVSERWGWFVALGILMVVLGVIAIGAPLATGIAINLLIGWLLIISGVAHGVHAFRATGWRGALLQVLCGLLYLGVGIMMITNPVWFNNDGPGSILFKRDMKEKLQYPHYNEGVLLALGFAIFNAMNFVKIRSTASFDMVGSLKTYYFGVLTTIPSIIICLVIQPELFAIWNIGTKDYPMDNNSILGSIAIGVFGWIT